MKELTECRICKSKSLRQLFSFEKMPVSAEPVPPGTNVPTHPLTVLECNSCGLVFLREVIEKEIYRDYIYTPQKSNETYLKWLVQRTKSFAPTGRGLEIGCGEGSLSKFFEEEGFSFLGIEPSKTLSKLSQVETINDFFPTPKINEEFDLVIVRHVLEHIDNLSEFVDGINSVLKKEGILVIEVPYLKDIVEKQQFYAFFFEHLSYFSISSISNILLRYNIYINGVDRVSPEGGSILLFCSRKPTKIREEQIETTSLKASFDTMKKRFGKKKFYAYGAGQRGITLLNMLGLNLLGIFDENPLYQGLVTPVSNVPIISPSNIQIATEPIIIFASSYEKEIRRKYKANFLSLSEFL